ncbi:MAG: flagellar hook-basal body complex protein [Pseudomonadota bacterium]
MENAITAALSQQIVLTRALEITANNIANQTTTGFKAERTQFNEYVSLINSAETGDRTVSLVQDVDSYTDFSPGGIQASHAALDFAIDGPGFFSVLNGDTVQYTRNGHFSLNAFGELVNGDGALVLDETGAPILIDPDQGPLLLSDSGELQQNEILIARIGVFTFDNLNALRRNGFNNYETDQQPNAVATPLIRQGFLEISNVAPVRAMTDMIGILRAYESAAQVIETSTELARDAVRTLTDAS